MMENLQGRTACALSRSGGAEEAACQRSGWWVCMGRGKMIRKSSMYSSRVWDRRLVPLCQVGEGWGMAYVPPDR